LEECGPCSVFAGFTLAFALQLRKEHGKTSVRVAEEFQTGTMKIHIYTIRIHKVKVNQSRYRPGGAQRVPRS